MPKLKTICILYPISFFPHIPQRHPLSWHFCASLSAYMFFIGTTHPPHIQKTCFLFTIKMFIYCKLLYILCTIWLNSHNFFQVDLCCGVSGLPVYIQFTLTPYPQSVSWLLNATYILIIHKFTFLFLTLPWIQCWYVQLST